MGPSGCVLRRRKRRAGRRGGEGWCFSRGVEEAVVGSGEEEGGELRKNTPDGEQGIRAAAVSDLIVERRVEDERLECRERLRLKLLTPPYELERILDLQGPEEEEDVGGWRLRLLVVVFARGTGRLVEDAALDFVER